MAWLAGMKARIGQSAIDAIRNRLRLSAYQLGRRKLQRYLERLQRFQPVALYGYSSAVYVLAQEAAITGSPCDTLKVVIMTSEPAFPHMIETVRQAFSTPVAVEYGAAECD